MPVRTRALVMGLMLLVGTSIATAGNFVCDDPEIVNVAEQARIRSAKFWSGVSLPGDWSAPCPIFITVANHAGGGRTSFHFQQGQVSGWRMEIAGTRDGMLRNVIPHEVDHMVRASLVRHPVERWLDEGCALLMESPEMHQHLRMSAAKTDPAVVTAHWLEAREYPRSAQQVNDLYAMGFSLVEFLLTRGSPARLLEFQRDAVPMDVRLQQHYGLTVDEFRSDWAMWRSSRKGFSCSEGRCAFHKGSGVSPSFADDSRPILILWTANWCGPCQKFKEDYAANSEFRRALDGAYRLQWNDVDELAVAAAAVPVQSVPLWILPDRQWIGYTGPEDLLRQLKVPAAVPPASSTDSVPAQRPPAETLSPPIKEMKSKAASPPPPFGDGSASSSPPGEAPPESASWGRRILQWAPLTLSALQWLGVVGGSMATGGVGGIALTAAMLLFRRQAASCKRPSFEDREAGETLERRDAAVTAPFPRELDEAGELLELRQTEGRVATLDTLRGMFLDDELDKLSQSSDPSAAQLAMTLRKAIDVRVDEVAPLTADVA